MNAYLSFVILSSHRSIRSVVDFFFFAFCYLLFTAHIKRDRDLLSHSQCRSFFFCCSIHHIRLVPFLVINCPQPKSTIVIALVAFPASQWASTQPLAGNTIYILYSIINEKPFAYGVLGHIRMTDAIDASPRNRNAIYVKAPHSFCLIGWVKQAYCSVRQRESNEPLRVRIDAGIRLSFNYSIGIEARQPIEMERTACDDWLIAGWHCL